MSARRCPRFVVGPSLTSLLPAFVACGGPPDIEGTVLDPWGVPVEGATVIMEGVAESELTDGDGTFSFEAREGPMNLLAGKEGYIKATATVTLSRSRNRDLPHPEIILYPDPEEPGFYAIDDAAYARIEDMPVSSVGTELLSYTGLADTGPHKLPRELPLRVVFSAALRPADVSRLDLRLHRLEFVPRASMKGALGETEVTINLWTAQESVPFDITGMYTRTEYLITTREPLEPGAYAFHIQSTLTDPDVHHLQRLPREMRVAYPFEIEE